MADDDPDDQLLASEALEEIKLPAVLYCVKDGEELLDYLYQRGAFANPENAPRPTIILLDLNMPKKDGRQALGEIKADPSLRRIPVVVLTTSNAQVDIKQAYDGGASSFITKPMTFDALVDVMLTLSKYWFNVVELPPLGSGDGHQPYHH
ncbi:response regulator [Ancylothrix sp. D3o]|uniref:response regulator n=1 Tax=Ancylothrix sp. D3o TaxID=2953691 RepID=UPI0021BABDAE|nr:response regulator [Ancylothrix sp. D3o]